MKNDESEKDKKNKGRFLSPSFRKGAVKEKKEEEDEGGFKINLIAAENDDDDESKSPSPPKAKKGKKKEDKEKVNIVPIKGDPKEKDKEKQKEHHHHRGSTHGISEDCKVNAIPEGRVKNVASYSQAGKGEDGFTKVNQDSFLVLQNQYNFKDFNIFAVMDLSLIHI